MMTLAQAIQRKAKKRRRRDEMWRDWARPLSAAVRWDTDFFADYVRQHIVSRETLVENHGGQ